MKHCGILTPSVTAWLLPPNLERIERNNEPETEGQSTRSFPGFPLGCMLGRLGKGASSC
jgi:hypothetical protein